MCEQQAHQAVMVAFFVQICQENCMLGVIWSVKSDFYPGFKTWILTDFLVLLWPLGYSNSQKLDTMIKIVGQKAVMSADKIIALDESTSTFCTLNIIQVTTN